jgi:TRAP-type mannitol/chloroaromatic compound transport system permease large subunit
LPSRFLDELVMLELAARQARHEPPTAAKPLRKEERPAMMIWPSPCGLLIGAVRLLGSGVWIGLALLGVGWIGMQLFTPRAAGDAMAVTIWGAGSSWTLTALPLFLWMGEILFRTKLSEDMFKGLAPWLHRLPGRLLHTNVIGCTIFAAVSGSSAATCATIGKMTLPELQARGYPEASWRSAPWPAPARWAC